MLIQEIETSDSISPIYEKGLNSVPCLPSSLKLSILNLPGCSEPVNVGNHTKNNIVIQWYRAEISIPV